MKTNFEIKLTIDGLCVTDVGDGVKDGVSVEEAIVGVLHMFEASDVGFDEEEIARKVLANCEISTMKQIGNMLSAWYDAEDADEFWEGTIADFFNFWVSCGKPVTWGDTLRASRND